MLVRFFEYGTQIALDDGEIEGNVLTVTFPHAGVLFLRHRETTPDRMRIRMITPGGDVEYSIQVMKAQKYTMEEMFGKGLLFLVPFYIFSHESRFEEYEKDKVRLEALKAEYSQIRAELERLMEQGKISEYTKCTLVDMSNKVLENIARKYHSVRKGVKDIMGGKVLEYEAKTIRNEGIEQGMEQGVEKGIRATVSILKNLGIPEQTIQVKIQEQYNLSREASKKYL